MPLKAANIKEYSDGFSSYFRQWQNTLEAKIVKKSFNESIRVPYPAKNARFRYLFSRLRRTALAVIENIAAELARSDFKPIRFELGFGGRDGDIPGVTIREDDTVLSVSGKVDRVDGWLRDGKLYLRVVDYKTGKKRFDMADLRAGLGLQMLLYLFTLEKEGSPYFGSPVVPAGVVYTPARKEIVRADRDVSPEKLEALLRRENSRTGLLLNDPEVLRAMEHSALESPCYLPITVNKNGDVINIAALEKAVADMSAAADRMNKAIEDEKRRIEEAEERRAENRRMKKENNIKESSGEIRITVIGTDIKEMTQQLTERMSLGSGSAGGTMAFDLKV